MNDKEAKVTVRAMFKKGGKLISESEEQEVVFVERIKDDAAYVTVSTDKKATKNLGNYESASLSAFMSVPCPMDEEQIENAFEFVDNFTTRKIEEMIEKHTTKKA